MSQAEIDRKQALSRMFAYSPPARGVSSGSFTRNSGRYGKSTREPIYQRSEPLPAPAPAPSTNTQQQSQVDLTINNPYRAEADRLLKTIQEMEAAKPKILFNNASPVSPSNQLQVSSASNPNKTSGTSTFKRRTKTTKKPTNILRTIQSVNV